MLAIHFHFDGRCDEAIELYERAFQTKIYDMERNENGRVLHAEMFIHGHRVMLNDHFGGKGNDPANFSIQMIPIFQTGEALLACYEILKEEALSYEPPWTADHSPLIARVTDKFGITWGMMVEQGGDGA